MTRVRGYKVFNKDWKCKDKQYTCPGKFEEDVILSVCNKGMHFYKKAIDCFEDYSFRLENKVAEVVAYGTVAEDGDKCCTDKLEIVREIPWNELLEIVNSGRNCTGLRNSGDYNSGDYNSGDCNSGNRNSGNRNSGDYNKCNFSNGCFNTIDPKIYLFNKPSEWTYKDWINSEAYHLMNHISNDVPEWVWFGNMTDAEKIEHPEAETTDGYLRKSDNSTSAVIWWRGLSDHQKSVIISIPNFDKIIFKEITGIDIEEKK